MSGMYRKPAKAEILHSGAYWQDLRRRRQLRQQRQQRMAVEATAAQGFVVTFCPRGATTVPARPVTTTNSILACRARDDEHLLERFASRKKMDGTSTQLASSATSSKSFKAESLGKKK
ncbi:hypothetical protein C8R43DRAFT_959793 [Mycena crocata]|nr:hypothetical protein C8R43DRAFT_959793 [Mycena crocata]